MACEECRRTALAENYDGLEYDVDRLDRVTRNHAILLIIVAIAAGLLIARLNDKGLLTYRELASGTAGG